MVDCKVLHVFLWSALPLTMPSHYGHGLPLSAIFGPRGYLPLTSALGHVWTAPFWQGLI
jgi:hypothetical protein